MGKEFDDLLIEVQTEELPPKALLKLAENFHQEITSRLQKLNLQFENAKFFATPRRLAVIVQSLSNKQPNQIIEKRGPAIASAFDKEGKPTQASLGFAKSVGATFSQLMTIKNEQGEWLGFKQEQKGKFVQELLPHLLQEALFALPIPKRMRWGCSEAQFVRPIHHLILLFGDQVIDTEILGVKTGRVTVGHRFMAPHHITIPHAQSYPSILETEGYVIADFAKRKQLIEAEAKKSLQLKIAEKGTVLISNDELLNEVTGLVEWPIALTGQFENLFLTLPMEVLISSMQDHQRYFPVVDVNKKLLPYFVTISNINSHEPQQVIHGNERVLRARLADAEFFYETDKKERLENRIERLKGIIFQAKLGTMFDKAERLSQLSSFIADKINANVTMAKRAALLAKTDLTTNMVNEFPELQGMMGYYYAIHDQEATDVAIALKEQYLPRFANDELPANQIGQVLAIADRLDSLISAFGINQIPTGDKDPYGLRRAALGVLRILIEKRINLDLNEVLQYAFNLFGKSLPNQDAVLQVLIFMQERLRAWYQEKSVDADVFAAVAALRVSNPLDIHERIKAVQAFKKLREAETLSIANKRVSNILTKYSENLDASDIDPSFFENEAEQELAKQLEAKSLVVEELSRTKNYNEVLLQLAELRKPVDDFFDHVMVMTENKHQRENRILILTKLRALFLRVADIALLQ